MTSSYKSNKEKLTHVYLLQTLNSIPIHNAVANINLDSNGRILSYGQSLFRIENDAMKTTRNEKPRISPADAVHALQQHLGLQKSTALTTLENGMTHKGVKYVVSNVDNAHSDVTAYLNYIQVNDGKNLELVSTIFYSRFGMLNLIWIRIGTMLLSTRLMDMSYH